MAVFRCEYENVDDCVTACVARHIDNEKNDLKSENCQNKPNKEIYKN